ISQSSSWVQPLPKACAFLNSMVSGRARIGPPTEEILSHPLSEKCDLHHTWGGCTWGVCFRAIGLGKWFCFNGLRGSEGAVECDLPAGPSVLGNPRLS